MKRKKIFFILSIFAASFWSLSAFAQANSDTAFANLSPEEFYIKMNRSYNKKILDVRLFSEYRQERIPGAVLASKREELIDIVDSLDRDLPLFVYCDDGQRSTTVCKILTNEKDFRNVYNLEEGLYMWKKVGLPIDDKKIKMSLWKRIFE